MDKVQTISTEKTLLPLGLALSMAVSVVGGTWWLSAMYSRVAMAEHKIGSLESSNHEVLQELKSVNYTLIEIKTVLKKESEK
jgi:hypothetical protein